MASPTQQVASPAERTASNPLFNLSPELRNNVYKHFLFSDPTPSCTLEYPLIKTNSRTTLLLAPIMNLDKTTRNEVTPLLYHNAELKMVPRPEFVLAGIPLSLTRSIPSWAKFSKKVEVEVRLRGPRTTYSRSSQPTSTTHGGNITLTFKATAEKGYVISGTATDPEQSDGREQMVEFMKAKAEQLKRIMVKALAGGTLSLTEIAGEFKVEFKKCMYPDPSGQGMVW